MAAMTASSNSQINAPPNPHHRRIDLQSPLDLQYLRQNLERSAQQKLDLHFPIIPSPEAAQANSSDPSAQPQPQFPEDPMRMRVSSLVSDFITQTFSSASHSVSVNGLDATSLGSDPSLPNPAQEAEEQIEYEAYDPRLTTKLSSLYAELEGLTTQVAKLRRDAPSQSAKNYSERLQEVMAEDDEAARQTVDNVPSEEDREARLQLNPISEAWQADIENMFRFGIDGLQGLTGNNAGGRGKEKSLTGTVGLVERAGVVARELE